ncbi:MAG: efflux RND transporter periplasmic adaptor subunit [Acidobacteria bacterium]|nr:efflux RND transporter periplasmic adaptor subunit [Acidobacteriota bacterium]
MLSIQKPYFVWMTLCLTVAVTAVGCSRSPSVVTAEPDGPIAVRAVQVQSERVQRRVEIVGTLSGEQEVTLSSEVAGRVAVVRADLGDPVSKGQVLLELDPTEFALAVERQHAALLEVLAQLGLKEEKDPLPELVDTSVVQRAEAEADAARADYERAKSLRGEGILSQQAYDSAEARFRTSQANYKAALEQARNLLARVENLRAQLGLAQQDLENTKVRAPFASTVRERLVEVGQYIREQTPVLSLVRTDPLKLRASVPERFFPYVPVGVAVEVAVEAYPGEQFSGHVTRVGQAIQPETRTFSIEARVDNEQRRLRPGLFARSILETSREDTVIRIPAAAVISFYGVQKVYCVEEGVIREKVVKLGDRFGERIEITDGLEAGEWVALSELTRLREGVTVRIEDSAGGKN